MPKIKFKRFKQESAHRQTDGNKDATKRIIAPAPRSIMNLYAREKGSMLLEAKATNKINKHTNNRDSAKIYDVF